MTAHQRRRRTPPAHANPDRWLVSYADFITLLFAFFTTMYAISTVDARKLSAVVNSMQAAFAVGEETVPAHRLGSRPAGTASSTARTGAARDVPVAAEPASAADVAEVKAHLDARLREQADQGLVELRIDPRGLVVSIREAGSFSTGSAELSPVARDLLSSVAGALKDVGNFVRIEGHTDDVPIHTERYASNWELSTARATAVVAYLISIGLEPGRMSAAGYGEFHPRVANDSDVDRARNRRVDLVVLNPTTRREEPAGLGGDRAAAQH